MLGQIKLMIGGNSLNHKSRQLDDGERKMWNYHSVCG